MKRHAAATAALVLPGRGELVDWRIERLSLLMNEDWLAGEWDPERQLILPSPGGRLTALTRADAERFLARIHSPAFRPASARAFGAQARVAAVEECALMIRESRSLGLLPTLGPTFAFRRGDSRRSRIGKGPGRALPVQVVAQLDNRLDLLAAVPGCIGPARRATLGALGERAGAVAVLTYLLLKGTGRRVGEVASLHLNCLDVDEYGKDVLVYDNHKAARMNRRLPLADSELVSAIRAQQAWVRDRFGAKARDSHGCYPVHTRTLTVASTCPAIRS